MDGHTLFVILYYASVVIVAGCCVVLSCQRESRMQKLALLVSFSLLICCIGFLFRIEAKSADAYIAGQKLIYCFVTHGMFLMLLFILDYCKFTIPKPVEIIFHSLNFFISAVVLSLNQHKLFYKSYWPVDNGGYCTLVKENGPLHTVALVLFGLYMVSALAVAVVYSIKNFKAKNRNVWRLLLAVSMPCLCYVIPKFTGVDHDLEPIAFAAFLVIVITMIYRNNLYDVDNIASEYSIKSMIDGIAVFSDKYNFKGCNIIAEKLFPALKGVDFGTDIRQAIPVFGDYLDGKISEYRQGNEIYEISVRNIEIGEKIAGRVLRFENATIRRNYTDLLESQVVTLSDYSYKDELTDLYNRRAFEEDLHEIRKGGNKSDITFVSMDLNGLKNVNDNIGHAAGDEIIKGAAQLMVSTFKDNGKVYRTGGDEYFAIVQGNEALAKNLCTKLMETASIWHGKMVDRLSIAYGIAGSTENEGCSVDELIIIADKAMYADKERYYINNGIDRRKA